MNRDRSSLVFLLLGPAIAAGLCTANGYARGLLRVAPRQELAILRTAHEIFSAPETHGARLGSISAFRPVTSEQTVLPVVGGTASANGIHWLRVLLPGRPNGHSGWIKATGTALTVTSWHIVVETAARRVRVYRSGQLIRSFAAVVGKPSTPTPHGRFFVEEDVRMPPGTAGAPFALALSARSDVLRTFEGGPGQIAIHGLALLVGTPGTAASHGCVRLATPNIRWLATHVTTGVPVTIMT